MDTASRFATLARQGLPFYEYAGEFCKVAVATVWDDATLNKLFWLGANHYRPVDLTELEGRCLPVSGECPGPSQNQPAVVRGSRKPAAVCGSSSPAAVRGQRKPTDRGSP